MPVTSGSPSQLKSSVSSISDLAGLPDDAFLPGDMAFVTATGRVYTLFRTVNAATDDVITVPAFSGNGYWADLSANGAEEVRLTVGDRLEQLQGYFVSNAFLSRTAMASASSLVS